MGTFFSNRVDYETENLFNILSETEAVLQKGTTVQFNSVSDSKSFQNFLNILFYSKSVLLIESIANGESRKSLWINVNIYFIFW